MLAVCERSFQVTDTTASALTVPVLDRRAKADASTQAIRKTLEMITPTTIVSILLLVSGVLLVSGEHGGLYVSIVPVLVALTGGIASAWLFLTKITE